MNTVYRRFQQSFVAALKLIAPVVLAVGFAAMGTGTASAVTFTKCSANASNGAVLGIDSTLVSSCLSYPGGSGVSHNLNGGSSQDGFLDLYADDGYEAISGWVTEPVKNMNPKTFSILSSLWDTYSSIVIGLKESNGWAVFFLNPNVTSGDWYSSKGLSHAQLYGLAATVPVPAGIALGASALGLLGFMGWRRKKTLAA